jgi:iron complex transport system substrate-binding protein
MGCNGPGASHAGPRTVVDDAGRTVAVEAPAMRVVSMLPAVTDMIVALGAADRLLLRTAYDTDPRIGHLPSLGHSLAASAETLVALRPDLVIESTALDPIDGPPLERIGLAVYEADVQSVADIGSTLERLGDLLGLEERADSMRRAIADGLSRVRDAVAGRSRPTVLYLIWPTPPRIAGPGSFIDQIINVAGGRIAFEEADIEWPIVSLESIVLRDPDWVVLGDGGSDVRYRQIQEAPGWRDLSAVREGRVVRVESNLFDRPGPRVIEAARLLASVLHPDVHIR